MSGEILLIVEDNMIVAMMVEDVLRDEGYDVLPTAETSVVALETVKDKKPALVLVDLDLEYKAAGIDLARQLQDLNVPCIYLTGQQELARSHPELALGLISKPVLPQSLVACVGTAVAAVAEDRRPEIDGCEWFDAER